MAYESLSFSEQEAIDVILEGLGDQSEACGRQ
jgi:GTP-sensing pleiotropic transcriptional regulator CodY